MALLLVAATVSWRHKVYYSGGLDPVVAAKGALSVLALMIAWVSRSRCRRLYRVGTRHMWMLVAFLLLSCFGAWSAGSLQASAVLAVRMLILAVTALLLMRSFAAERILRDLLTSMLALGLLGAATGFQTYLAGGRLNGGIPPLNPNEIAMLLGLPAIGLVWLALTGRGRTFHGLLMIGILGVVWTTGSRTGLLALFLAVVVMVVQAKKLKPLFAFLLACVVPVLLYVALGTQLLAGYFERGGTASVGTLSSRTIAWSAAFTYPDTDWVRFMGSGLAVKKIPVAGQYWDTQGLDSSWVSAMVQGGLLGAGLLLVWAISGVAAALRCPPQPRMIFTGVLAFILIRSILESGLLDSTPAFIMFVVVTILTDKTSRPQLLQTDWELNRTVADPVTATVGSRSPGQ